LSFIAQLSKHIRISGDEESKDEATEFHRFFPSFVWVVRDFSLSLVDEDGEPISALDYLERSLAPQSGFDKPTMERNRVRQMLTAFFTERKCTTLVRPLMDENALQQVDLVAFENLREEFRMGLNELKRAIFSTPRLKQINGKSLTGSMFAALCQAYVDAINSGGVPTISSAWEDVTMKENQQAMETAESEYRLAMDQLLPELPVEETVVMDAHKQAVRRAVDVYLRRAVGDAARKGRDTLVDKLDLMYADRAERNLAESQTRCSQILQRLYTQHIDPLTPHLSADDVSYQQVISTIRATWMTALEQYYSQAVGPGKHVELAKFANPQLLSLLQLVASSMQQKYEHNMNQARTQLLQAQQEASILKANQEVLEAAITAKDARLEELSQQYSLLTAEVASLKERVADLTQKKREVERKAEEHEDSARQLRDKLTDREITIQRLEEKTSKLGAEIEELKQVIKEKDAEL
jgi:hypothetical protein